MGVDRYYGALPDIIGEYPIEFSEICFYQYMPVKLTNIGVFGVHIPDRLQCFASMVDIAYEDFLSIRGTARDCYVYLTVKHVHVSPEYWGNRQGWHTDGFGTDDINYIWYDKNPTIFSSARFGEISDDCQVSIEQFAEQTWKANQTAEQHEHQYPPFTLLRLDQFVVHKVAPVTESGFRTFVKITFSKNKYNLKGNTHNYLLDYKWDMKERSKERNHPSK